MRKVSGAVLLLLVLMAWWSRSAADPFMPVTELRRGMRGTGRTVFQGSRIDTFSVELLGVVERSLGPRRDLIVARLSGGPLADTGVIRGMSGSPVYVAGRLVGAVAYGWTFSSVPICGITPIRDMLDVMDRGVDVAAPGGRIPGPVELGPEGAALLQSHLSAGDAGSALALQPLATPVWVSGLSGAGAALLRQSLHPYGLEVLEAPGGQLSVPGPPLEPGAPLGVQLISGDVSATGVGTVTYVQGNRVLAFGHPLLLAGATDMPMTGAYIHDIVPNQVSSFKLGAATLPVGAVRQDRAAAIAGMLGHAPAMLPVTVDLASGERSTPYRFGVVRHRDLLPALTRAVLMGVLEASEKLFGDATLEVHVAMRLGDGRLLAREHVHSGPLATVEATAEACRPLALLLQSPFQGLSPDSLHVSLGLRERLLAAQVVSLRASASVVEPGDSLGVSVTLQPYDHEPVTQRLALRLPEDLPAGPVELRAGSGTASRLWEEQRRPDAAAPRSARQLVELLAESRRDDQLVVEVFHQEESYVVGGRELPALPPSARTVLAQDASAGHTGPVHGRVLLRQSVPSDYVLSGEQVLQLTVRKP
ncbi:MAG: hypothetical protein AB1505_02930 [Candidatus Latescibacterota bacterium]